MSNALLLPNPVSDQQPKTIVPESSRILIGSLDTFFSKVQSADLNLFKEMQAWAKNQSNYFKVVINEGVLAGAWHVISFSKKPTKAESVAQSYEDMGIVFSKFRNEYSALKRDLQAGKLDSKKLSSFVNSYVSYLERAENFEMQLLGSNISGLEGVKKSLSAVLDVVTVASTALGVGALASTVRTAGLTGAKALLTATATSLITKESIKRIVCYTAVFTVLFSGLETKNFLELNSALGDFNKNPRESVRQLRELLFKMKNAKLGNAELNKNIAEAEALLENVIKALDNGEKFPFGELALASGQIFATSLLYTLLFEFSRGLSSGISRPIETKTLMPTPLKPLRVGSSQMEY